MDEFARYDWPSRSYMLRVARAGLLTREGEIELARRRDRGWAVGRWLALAGDDAREVLNAWIAERRRMAPDRRQEQELAALLRWQTVQSRCRRAVARKDWAQARAAVDQLRPAFDSIPLDDDSWRLLVMRLAETLAEGLGVDEQERARLARLEQRLGYPRDRWIELSQAIVAGERDAKRALNDLVEANLRLVMFVVRRYRGQTMMPLADLVQEGNLGLIRAAEKFDPRRGVRFATFAIHWIRQGITRSLSNHSRTVRISVDSIEKLSKIKQLRHEYGGRDGGEPTAEELAKQLGLSVKRVEHLLTIGFEPLPLDARVDDDRSLLDVLEDPRAVDPVEHVSSLERRPLPLGQLTEGERRVLRLRFGFEPIGELVRKDVARELSITWRRVRAIEAQALEKLRLALGPGPASSD